jgi:hypothetical protein
MRSSLRIKNILVTAFVLETLCVTYAQHLPPIAGITSILYTVAGIVIAYCLLWMPDNIQQRSKIISSKPLNRYRWLFLAIGLLVMCKFVMQWIEDDPLNYHDADMLPIIKIMCERFLSGAWSHVYDPIPEIWNGTRPIYLPAMWLPFNFPVWLHIDVRWLTVTLLLIVLGIFLWKINPVRKKAWLVFLCAFLLFLWLFTDEKPGLVPNTEEGVIIFYYVLLTVALMDRRIWLIGICASLCVLSRYALIGWLPAMLIYFVYNKEWKNLWRFVIAGISCFVVLLLLPFGWGIFSSLITLPGSYIDFTRRVWNDAPHVFTESLGWAKFFGPQRIATLHYLLLSLSFLVPVLCMIAGLRLYKKYKFPVQNLALAVLKITMVIFYSLVDVTYLYLFYTSSFVSLIAVSYFLTNDTTDNLPQEVKHL